MLHTMLKCKIHRATVTSTELHYMGSLAVDTKLMKAAGLLPYEKVELFDINNGRRLETYVIPAPAASGAIEVKGAAARLIEVGDLVIVLAYVQLSEHEIDKFAPTLVTVDEYNKIVGVVRVDRTFTHKEVSATA